MGREIRRKMMAQQQVAPYGSWKSPITSELIVSETIGLGQIALQGEDTYWVEMTEGNAEWTPYFRAASRIASIDTTRHRSRSW